MNEAYAVLGTGIVASRMWLSLFWRTMRPIGLLGGSPGWQHRDNEHKCDFSHQSSYHGPEALVRSVSVCPIAQRSLFCLETRDLFANRREGAVLMLFLTEAVGVWAVGGVDRLLQKVRKISIESFFVRPR